MIGKGKENTVSLRELHGIRLGGYSLGNFGMMLLLFITESYSFNFYVYTLRIDSILVSIGTTINMITMAFSSIIFGVVLDNTKPRKIGKRRPYLLIGLPIWAISAILVYVPPWIPPKAEAMAIFPETVIYWPTAIWYWVMNMLKGVFGSLMMIVFSSVLPEISQTLKNRKKAAMVSANLRVVSSIISIAFPNILQSLLEDPQNTAYWTDSGKFVKNVMPPISIIFGILATICILISFFSIDESFHSEESNFEKRTIKDTFKNLFIPAKDKEYMKYLVAGVTSQTSQFALVFTIIPFIAFVLGQNLLPAEISDLYIWYIVISISTKFFWLYIWKLIMKRQAKLLRTYKLNILVIIIAAFFELLFLSDMHIVLRMILFILSFGTVLGSMYATSIFSQPLLNEMVDRAAEMYITRNEKEFIDKGQAVTRLSGAYYGLFMFSTSVLAAISASIYGVIFRGSNSRNPIILTLGLASMGLFYIISLIFLQLFKVKLKES
ncbi:MAG: MFS transporter [Candidatus Hermodarchaeota archaeon]